MKIVDNNEKAKIADQLHELVEVLKGNNIEINNWNVDTSTAVQSVFCNGIQYNEPGDSSHRITLEFTRRNDINIENSIMSKTTDKSIK